MNEVIVGMIGIAILFMLMSFRMPIGFALGIVGFIGAGYLTNFHSAMQTLIMESFYSTASYTMSVVPLFVLMGQFISYSGIAEDAYYAAHKWVGRLPGGIAIATIIGCALFAAVSGSSLATAATFGKVSLPEMRKLNYAQGFSSGCLAAGSTLGIMIPPSVILIFYGVIAEESVGSLFLAGIIPGILLTFLLSLYVFIYACFDKEITKLTEKESFINRMLSLKKIWGVVIIFILVMGSIYAGICTPNEAGAIGAVGALVFALSRKKMSWNNLINSLIETAKVSAMLIIILIGASIFNNFMVITEIPKILAGLVTGIDVHYYFILIIILLIYLLLGCFLDSFAMITITLPLFLPAIVSMGYDPIWFGIIMVIVSAMGLITPPLGLNVYVIAGISNIDIYTLFKGVIPFLLIMILFSIIIIVFPEIVMFLPDMM